MDNSEHFECIFINPSPAIEAARYKATLIYLEDDPIDFLSKQSVATACKNLNLTPKHLESIIHEFNDSDLVQIGTGIPAIEVELTPSGHALATKYRGAA